MTTPEAVARNHAAIRALADRLEREGWTGDAIVAAEEFAALLARHGWKPTEPPPPLHGPASTEAGRKAARRLFEQTRREKGSKR
jgi:hypothetical protein